jgi:hypothetical protein
MDRTIDQSINDYFLFYVLLKNFLDTYLETLPLPIKGCKILAYVRRSGPLSREGSLSCHTCCDTGLSDFTVSSEGLIVYVPLKIFHLHSNVTTASDSYFTVSSEGPPHLVAFYDTHRDDNLF